MYSGRGFRESEIGDIEIIKSGDTYHLFHLILPNHDYIAHAVSKDCINWKRVKNALWVGDPGEWDDDMLWTMNVIKSDGQFEMFYTGLNQKEHGLYQKIGKAVSHNLMDWRKVNDPPFPIESSGPYYESRHDNNRQWVSFRDPFIFDHQGRRYILICARSQDGQMSRRGLVGIYELDGAEARPLPPLFYPRVYDDIECPCLLWIGYQFYLIGSIREDIKVHYWYADTFPGDFKSFHDNVLLPQGNYAARVMRDGDRFLLFCFYVSGDEVENAHRYLPPPKELAVDTHGKLILRTYYAWPNKVLRSIPLSSINEPIAILRNPSAEFAWRNPLRMRLSSHSGYEVFLFSKPSSSYLWNGSLRITGLGKCGFVIDSDADGNAIYISLDVVIGLAQIRLWGVNPQDIHRDYIFKNIQTNNFRPNPELQYTFGIIRYGSYIEFVVDDVVILSLVNASYQGPFFGVYCESAEVEISESEILVLDDSMQDELENFQCFEPLPTPLQPTIIPELGNP
ncbi:MAG: glycosyl hydrolase family 32 [Verrucomicrobia bacterium]|nr:glycosyl hydrolase family 32 [Verrucomicrobiota bacterium]